MQASLVFLDQPSPRDSSLGLEFGHFNRTQGNQFKAMIANFVVNFVERAKAKIDRLAKLARGSSVLVAYVAKTLSSSGGL